MNIFYEVGKVLVWIGEKVSYPFEAYYAEHLKRSNAAKREEDYWRYKDGEQIDTNAKHYEDMH